MAIALLAKTNSEYRFLLFYICHSSSYSTWRVGFGLFMKNGDAVKVEKRFRYLDDLHIFLWHIFLWHIFLWHIFLWHIF
ncbi:MAG: hypothetical protein MJ069_09010, partial [Salinivirgaceae bacterium]|nr:hypothetical protein [Salinivirgaceae bacterium]